MLRSVVIEGDFPCIVHLLRSLVYAVRFERILLEWSHLSSGDARTLLRTLLLSEDAFRRVPLTVRLMLTDAAVAAMADGEPQVSSS